MKFKIVRSVHCEYYNKDVSFVTKYSVFVWREGEIDPGKMYWRYVAGPLPSRERALELVEQYTPVYHEEILER